MYFTPGALYSPPVCLPACPWEQTEVGEGSEPEPVHLLCLV